MALEAAYWWIIAIRNDSGGGAKNQTLVRHHFQLHVRVLWHSIGLPRGTRANQPNRTDRSRSRPRSGLAFIISAGAVPPSRAVHSSPPVFSYNILHPVHHHYYHTKFYKITQRTKPIYSCSAYRPPARRRLLLSRIRGSIRIDPYCSHSAYGACIEY